MRVASCNVLTLKCNKFTADDGNDVGLTGPARLQSVLRQFAEQEVSVLALQETRLRRTARLMHEQFHLIHSPAASTGHFGILVGLHKQIFSESSYVVIASDPRILICRVAEAQLKFVLVAVHAPHSGQSDEEISTFWTRVRQLIPASYREWPKLLCADANCRVGDCHNDCIGGHASDQMSSKCEPFVEFVADQQVFLPSTFESSHVGPSGTWRHSSGSWSRIDYVGLPLQWPLTSCQSWVSEDIDVSLVKEDHRVVLVDCTFWLAAGTHVRTKPAPKIQFDSIDIEQLNHARSTQWICPTLDVHTHATQLQHYLTQFQIQHVTKASSPLKTTMTDATWDLVCTKREWRLQLAQRQRIQDQTLLLLCFASWKHQSHAPVDEAQIHEFDVTLKRLDVDVAIALQQFRFFGILVSRALRADDRAFYRHLASECGEWLAPADVKRFWAIIRRSLPKYRQRKIGAKPLQLEFLEDQWEPYFRQLELGYSVTPDSLVNMCHAHQLSKQPASIPEVTALPSILDLEDELKASSMHRATGYDPLPADLFHLAPVSMADLYLPLMLKMFFWQHEPIVSKGGPLALLPKRLHPTEASHFRGIMLLPTFSKRVHALLRKALIARMRKFRLPGQLGGFPGQMVSFGSQALQTYARIMDSFQFSSGVVFIDLTNAFHRLVREFVSGTAIPSDQDAIVSALAKAGFCSTTITDHLANEPLLEKIGCPAFLTNLLQDVHTFTWFTIGRSAAPNVTRRGTRPGSPLADVIFHILMSDIMNDFRHWMEAQVDYQEILKHTDADGEPIIWSDDVAIPWCTREASALPPALKQVVSKMHDLFAARGFHLNFAKGKTSIVATFRGKDAPALRRQYQMSDCPVDCLETAGAQYPLHYVSTYKHLGTIFASSHHLDKEIDIRVALATQAFNELSRPVLCNKHLPVRVRMRMFQSLIGSRLFFGLGAWPTPSNRQLTRLRGILLRFVRRVLRLPVETSVPQAVVLQFGSVLCLDPRARLAMERLLFFFLRLPYGQYGPVSQLSRSEESCTGPFNWGEAHCAGEKVKRKIGPFLRKSL